MKLILVIDWVRALKSQLVRGIEFSRWNQWLVFMETASQKGVVAPNDCPGNDAIFFHYFLLLTTFMEG